MDFEESFIEEEERREVKQMKSSLVVLVVLLLLLLLLMLVLRWGLSGSIIFLLFWVYCDKTISTECRTNKQKKKVKILRDFCCK